MIFQPVIVIGAPRSGTNMLRDVLTRVDHFQTWPCDEINFVWKHGNLDYRGDDLEPEQIRPQTQKFVQSQFQKIARKSGAAFVVEKTCANSLRIPFVDALVPDAKYVLIVRDGRDAIASTIRRWQTPDASVGYFWQKFKYVAPGDRLKVLFGALGKRFSIGDKKSEQAWSTWGPVFPELLAAIDEGKSLAEVCSIQWAQCVKSSIHALAEMDPSRWLAIRYEDFVSNPRAELPRVLAFLEVAFTQAQVASAVSNVHPGSVGNSVRTVDGTSLKLIDAVIAESGLDLDSLFRK